MLYDRWCALARERRREIALRDLAADRSWTFAELHQAGDASPEPAGEVVFPTGRGAAFVIEVLRGWRWRRLVCPLDAEQPVPAVLQDGHALRAARQGSLRDSAHLKLTSASTGPSRLVAFTGEQLAADAANLVPAMGLRREWWNVGALSLAHSYGFSNLVTPLLLHGLPLILPGSALPEAVRRTQSAAPELALPGVPALWRAWHDADAIPANTRLAISAGAPLPLALESEVFAARGIKIHNFYGSTECGGIAYDDSPQPRRNPAAAGALIPGVQVSVGESGCLEVRGPAVGQGYWPDSDPALGEGCFRTSDLAVVEEGKVLLRGRAGDLINVAGRKVAPDVVERALESLSAVRECVVFGLPAREPGRGEDVAAFVVLRAPASEAELRSALAGRLQPWQAPRVWLFGGSLPVNERGKLSRKELARRFASPG